MQPASCTQGSSGRGLKTAGVKTQLGDPGWKAAEENETLGSKAWYENSGRRSSKYKGKYGAAPAVIEATAHNPPQQQNPDDRFGGLHKHKQLRP